jgi:DNA-binding CsgD family transcriptional regulator
MENLSNIDNQKLHQSIEKLYTFHELNTFGLNIISLVHQLVPSDVPLFHITDVQTGEIEDTMLSGYESLTPELANIKRSYLSEHPITQNMPQALSGACKISDFASPQELHSLEGIYQKFLRPLATEDQMMLFLPSHNSGDWQQLSISNTVLIGVCLNRSERSFTERDRLILNLLRPHLAQAYNNAQKYQQLQQKAPQTSVNMIVLDTEGRVNSITPQATQWLEIYFPKFNYWEIPDELWSWIKHQVQKFCDPTYQVQACQPFCINQANQQLVIHLINQKDQDRYTLLLEEKTTSLLDSLAILGLSQRETEILAWIIQGKDNKMIAIELGIGTSTVRKHLESIYRQWHINSRTEAIAQALTRLGFMQ